MMTNTEHESKNVGYNCKERGTNSKAKNRKNRKAARKEAKTAKQAAKETGKNIFDNLSLAQNNARKNVGMTKPLVRIDWSTDETFEDRVRKISIDSENIQIKEFSKDQKTKEFGKMDKTVYNPDVGPEKGILKNSTN